eukprot:2464352-Prymnesium_polylepis.1
MSQHGQRPQLREEIAVRPVRHRRRERELVEDAAWFVWRDEDVDADKIAPHCARRSFRQLPHAAHCRRDRCPEAIRIQKR